MSLSKIEKLLFLDELPAESVSCPDVSSAANRKNKLLGLTDFGVSTATGCGNKFLCLVGSIFIEFPFLNYSSGNSTIKIQF